MSGLRLAYDKGTLLLEGARVRQGSSIGTL